MRQSQRLIRSALANFLGKGVGVVGGLILAPFVVGQIGADSYGAVVVINSLLQFVALVQLGTPQALQRFVPREIVLDQRDKLSRFTSTGLALLLGAAAVASLGLLAVLAAPRVFLSAPASLSLGSLRSVVAIMGLVAVLAIPLSLGQVVLYATERFRLLNVVLIGGTLLRVILVFGLLSSFEGSVLAYVVANGAATLLPAFVIFFAGRRLLPQARYGAQFVDRTTAARITGYGAEVFYNSLLALLYLQADYLIIGKTLGSVAVTTFSLAVLWGTVTRNVIATAVSVLLPTAASKSALGDTEALRLMLLRSTKYALVLGLLPVVFLAVFRYEVIAVWLGPGFESTAALIVPLLIAEILSTGILGAAQICTGTGHVRLFTVTNTSFAIANVALVALLLGPGGFGLGSVAWSYCVLFALRSGVVLPVLVARALGLSPKRLYGESYLRPLAAAGAAVLLALVLRSAWAVTGWATLSVAGLTFTMAYLPLAYRLALDGYDRRLIASSAAQVASRFRRR